MKALISITFAALATVLLAGCVENDTMHVGSILSSPSASAPAFGTDDTAASRKYMENRTF
jgi:outer membrane murein-binding lipoprotein Lpp